MKNYINKFLTAALLLAAAFLASPLKAQVTVGAQRVPNSTLEVVKLPATSTTPDGIIAPQLSGAELQAADAKYGPAQTSAIVYATSASPDAGVAGKKTAYVTAPGYYYFTGLVWEKITDSKTPAWLLGGNANGSLKTLGTKDSIDLPIITNNTEKMRVTAGGNVGINTNNPTNTLHIVGDTARVKGQAFRLVDGSQGANKLLVSDSLGVGNWQVPFGGTKIGNTVHWQNISMPVTSGVSESVYLDPQSYIDLEPGIWKIEILSEFDFPASMQSTNYSVEAAVILMPADSAAVLFANGHIPTLSDVLYTNCYYSGSSVGVISVNLYTKNRLNTSFFQVNCTNQTVRYRVVIGRFTLTTFNGATVPAGQNYTWLPPSRDYYLFATRTVWMK